MYRNTLSLMFTVSLLALFSPPGAAGHGDLDAFGHRDAYPDRVWRVGERRHDWGRAGWPVPGRRDHWYYDRRLPVPWVGYRDRWGWGRAHRNRLLLGVPLGGIILGEQWHDFGRRDPRFDLHRRGDWQGGWRERHRPGARPRISACYRIDRLPGGRERRVELPLAACR